MCIIAVASGCHPDFPLVCIHNREEVAGRPTSSCERRNNDVICAIDELKGGTWMGMNMQTGLFCSLTNLRWVGPPRTNAASRGLLVSELLEAPATGLTSVLSNRSECTAQLRAAMAARPYEGLNLCVGNWYPNADGSPPAVFYASNVPPGANTVKTSSHGWTQHVEQLAPGVTHAWSNNAPAAPAWPKSTWLRSNLAQLLSNTKAGPTAGGTAGAAVTLDTAALTFVQATNFTGCATCSLPPSTEDLLRNLCALLSTTVDYSESDLPAPDFSPLEPWQETHLQRGPFVRYSKRWASYGGTRSQTIILADRRSRVTWYCYRETDSDLPGGGCGMDEAYTTRARSSADHRLHVLGVPWPHERGGRPATGPVGRIPALRMTPCVNVGVLAVVVSLMIVVHRQ